MTLDEALALLPQVGTSGVLAVALYYTWKEKNELRRERDAEAAGRLADAKEVVPLVLRLHELSEREDRSTRP